jgi:hypothetical protein
MMISEHAIDSPFAPFFAGKIMGFNRPRSAPIALPGLHRLGHRK